MFVKIAAIVFLLSCGSGILILAVSKAAGNADQYRERAVLDHFCGLRGKHHRSNGDDCDSDLQGNL